MGEHSQLTQPSPPWTEGPPTAIATQHQPGGWRHGYEPVRPWGSAFVQWGPRFFEAFPAGWGYFRGTGEDTAAAEACAWQKFSRARACNGHDFDRRGYRNGGAVCKDCGIFAMVFEPLERCEVCGVATYHSTHEGKWRCEAHHVTQQWEIDDQMDDLKVADIAAVLARMTVAAKDKQ